MAELKISIKPETIQRFHKLFSQAKEVLKKQHYVHATEITYDTYLTDMMDVYAEVLPPN